MVRTFYKPSHIGTSLKTLLRAHSHHPTATFTVPTFPQTLSYWHIIENPSASSLAFAPQHPGWGGENSTAVFALPTPSSKPSHMGSTPVQGSMIPTAASASTPYNGSIGGHHPSRRQCNIQHHPHCACPLMALHSLYLYTFMLLMYNTITTIQVSLDR